MTKRFSPLSDEWQLAVASLRDIHRTHQPTEPATQDTTPDAARKEQAPPADTAK
jgi:hypothetical protein